MFGLYFSLQSEKSELISQIKILREDNRQIQSLFDEKMKEIEPLQQALGKLRNSNNAGRGGICSSEEELNNFVCYESLICFLIQSPHFTCVLVNLNMYSSFTHH